MKHLVGSMSVLCLTIEVFNLSPMLTSAEVETFFSYCGNVDNIQLHKNEDALSQSALVTFRQPFAFQTALLMNDVPIDGYSIRVVPSKDGSAQLNEEQDFSPLVQPQLKPGNTKNWSKMVKQSICRAFQTAEMIILMARTNSSLLALVLLVSTLLYNFGKHAFKAAEKPFMIST